MTQMHKLNLNNLDKSKRKDWDSWKRSGTFCDRCMVGEDEDDDNDVDDLNLVNPKFSKQTSIVNNSVVGGK